MGREEALMSDAFPASGTLKEQREFLDNKLKALETQDREVTPYVVARRALKTNKAFIANVIDAIERIARDAEDSLPETQSLERQQRLRGASALDHLVRYLRYLPHAEEDARLAVLSIAVDGEKFEPKGQELRYLSQLGFDNRRYADPSEALLDLAGLAVLERSRDLRAKEEVNRKENLALGKRRTELEAIEPALAAERERVAELEAQIAPLKAEIAERDKRLQHQGRQLRTLQAAGFGEKPRIRKATVKPEPVAS
jgi:hypothetical protein